MLCAVGTRGPDVLCSLNLWYALNWCPSLFAPQLQFLPPILVHNTTTKIRPKCILLHFFISFNPSWNLCLDFLRPKSMDCSNTPDVPFPVGHCWLDLRLAACASNPRNEHLDKLIHCQFDVCLELFESMNKEYRNTCPDLTEAGGLRGLDWIGLL